MGSLRARLSGVGRLLLLASSAALATLPSPSFALSVQEVLLRAKPAVALITAEVKATVTVSCGREPVTVTPRPFIEAGTAWFVDGPAFLITNAHVVDPAHRLLPWVVHDLKRRAIDEACVEPALRSRGLVPRQKPEIEIKKRVDGGERRLNLVNEGELLGEMALFRKAPRSASAVAVTDAEFLVVQSERLGWLIRNRPEPTLERRKRLSDQIVSRDTDGGTPSGAPSPPPDPPGTGGRPGADSP